MVFIISVLILIMVVSALGGIVLRRENCRVWR
jgi:hypothetical protein